MYNYLFPSQSNLNLGIVDVAFYAVEKDLERSLVPLLFDWPVFND